MPIAGSKHVVVIGFSQFALEVKESDHAVVPILSPLPFSLLNVFHQVFFNIMIVMPLLRSRGREASLSTPPMSVISTPIDSQAKSFDNA